MKPYYLYELEFPNGKKYLGITHQPNKRWRQQCQAAARRKNDFPLYRAIRKYGKESVNRRILVVGDLEFIREMEVRAIAAYASLAPSGYNAALGGQVCLSMRLPEIARKVGEAQRRLWATDAYREKMKAKFKQRVRSDEHKANLSRAKKMEWKNPRSRQKYVESHLGNKPTDETRRKMSASQKGHPNYNNRKMIINEKGQFVRAAPDGEVATLTHITESA